MREDKERFKDFLDELQLSYKCSHFEVFPDTEVLWFEENKSLFIRGSDSCVDWFYNFLAIPTPYSDFHLGYHIKANCLVDACLDRRIEPTTVVGHSAGGAVAQWVAFFFWCEAYALACPKTCLETKSSKEFRTWADENLVIINQEKDWLTYLPPWMKHPIDPLVLDTTDYPILAHSLISFE